MEYVNLPCATVPLDATAASSVSVSVASEPLSDDEGVSLNPAVGLWAAATLAARAACLR